MSPKLAKSNILSISPDGTAPTSVYLPSHARDVPSPWGNMRAYEWGSSTGRKVLLIHGLSTPSAALAAIGQRLVEGGCRVMIIDLWGRGFSATPVDLPHDERLYASQCLLAISTSSLQWTGSGSDGFSIVGYSMGGAIAMSFARWFPQLVNSIVLMAPGGLYQHLPREYRACRVRYPWMFPRVMVTSYIQKLLNGTTESSWLTSWSRKSVSPTERTKEDEPEDHINVVDIVNHEIEHHPGFVHSISSALQYAPVVRQHALWTEVRNHLEGSSHMKLDPETPNRLAGTKILLLLGEDDQVLHQGYQQDIVNTLGSNNLEIHTFEGGHSFPIGANSKRVAETMLEFWGNEVTIV